MSSKLGAIVNLLEEIVCLGFGSLQRRFIDNGLAAAAGGALGSALAGAWRGAVERASVRPEFHSGGCTPVAAISSL